MTNNDELAFIAKAALKAGQGSKEMAGFRVTANPANILALLEERDADKKLIAELNDTLERECEKSRRMASLIAELEARTVSVKLPENIPCPGAPQTIWLQTNGDDSNESSWPENSNDVSWCWEKMFHNDTLYVRADLAAGIKLEVGE